MDVKETKIYDKISSEKIIFEESGKGHLGILTAFFFFKIS